MSKTATASQHQGWMEDLAATKEALAAKVPNLAHHDIRFHIVFQNFIPLEMTGAENKLVQGPNVSRGHRVTALTSCSGCRLKRGGSAKRATSLSQLSRTISQTASTAVLAGIFFVATVVASRCRCER